MRNAKKRKKRKIRKAGRQDWEEILRIYAGARRFMAEHGNAGQWGENYPPKELLERDMAEGKLYVCTAGKQIEAVFYFAVEEEPSYRVIEDGAWLDEAPYGVVHRIASAGTSKGAASFCLGWAYGQAGNIRIDTHENNLPMQNVLKKNGFRYCGRIYLENGEPRLAFQLSRLSEKKK
ncbi:MAG: GNAT family N-acetyltransferase [bacterium]|nr:GNAT family N-acetyltransferase [bacterium]